MTTTSLASAAPAASATSLALSIHLLSRDFREFSGFFPFNDLEAIGSLDSYGLFQKLPIDPWADDDRHMSLFASGCQTGGDKADCPRACGDPTTLFGSLETFYNCASLSSITYWTRMAKAYHVPEEAERNASLVMAGVPLAEFDAPPVLSSFVSCAQAACSVDKLRKACSPSIRALSPRSEPIEVLEAISDFCPELPVEINPDIFGPGVLVSYVLQVCFASLLYVMLKAFALWVRLLQKEQPPRRREGVSVLNLTRRLTWNDSSALSRTSMAIAATLVEFQEAQCWFVFAIQIASILAVVVDSQGGQCWGDIIVNAAVAFHVSQNGILSMFLIQICLHSEGIHNWHTFLGFFAEYLLAIVATSQTVKFRDAFELFRKQRQVGACGGNPSPRSYCASMRRFNGFNLNFFPRPYVYKIVFLVLDTVAILVLLVDQLSWTLRAHRRTSKLRIGGHPLGRGPVGRFKPGWTRLKRWVWRTLEVAYLVINLLYMVSLVKTFNNKAFEASNWSYGQIIAMTVWGPVVVKLFALVLSGPPKNGSKLNSGPPRLRIDNAINRRLGAATDDEPDGDACAPRLRRKGSGGPGRDLEQVADDEEGGKGGAVGRVLARCEGTTTTLGS